MQRLADIGFRIVGKWYLSGRTMQSELHDCADSRNVLYAFTSGKRVLYVGKTVQMLRKRLSGFRTPGRTQWTNIKVHKSIKKLLQQRKAVRILALPDTGLLEHHGLHVNLAAGLEDSVIRDLKPEWNDTGT